jgi:hypothetical protein
MDLSTDGMMLSMVLGTVGFSLFVYGKKQERFPQLVGGVALMVFPYFVSGTAWTLGMAAAIAAGVILAVNAGY